MTITPPTTPPVAPPPDDIAGKIDGKIIEIAQLASASEREAAIDKLRTWARGKGKNITKAALREDVKKAMRRLAEEEIERKGQELLQAVAAKAPRSGLEKRQNWIVARLRDLAPDGRIRSQDVVDAALGLLNDEYFVVRAGSKPAVMYFEDDFIAGDPEEGVEDRLQQSLEAVTPEGLNTLHRNIRYIHMDVSGKAVETTISNLWLNWIGRREYRRYTFDPRPEANDPDVLNLWRGLAVEPMGGGGRASQLFVTHVSKLCSGDVAVTNYFLDWVALLVQKPWVRHGVMIMLIGEQGTGKGAVGNLIMKIFGRHAIRAGNKNTLLGRFNQHLRTAVFVFADEALFAGDREAADALKGLLTESRIRFERKHFDSTEGRNFMSVMAATNHAHAAQVEISDRRTVAIEVPPSMKGDHEWFTEFFKTCYAPEGVADILAFLLKRDLSKFHPERDMPVTAATTAQKNESLHGDMLFWRQALDTASWNPAGLPNFIPPYDFAGDVVTAAGTADPTEGMNVYLKKDVYQAYLRWQTGAHRRGTATYRDVFFKNLLRWSGALLVRRTIKPVGQGKDAAGSVNGTGRANEKKRDAAEKARRAGRHTMVALPDFERLAEAFANFVATGESEFATSSQEEVELNIPETQRERGDNVVQFDDGRERGRWGDEPF